MLHLQNRCSEEHLSTALWCFQLTYRKVRNLRTVVDKLVGKSINLLHHIKSAACIIIIVPTVVCAQSFTPKQLNLTCFYCKYVIVNKHLRNASVVISYHLHENFLKNMCAVKTLMLYLSFMSEQRIF